MKNQRNQRRYAEALYEVACEHNVQDKIEKELLTVRQVFTMSSDLIFFLQDPNQWMNRAKIIKSTFTLFSLEIVKLLLIMVEHHAEQDVPGMVDHYIHLISEDRGIGIGKVYSVTRLTPKQLSDMEKGFAKSFSYHQLTLQNEVDETLIGGFKIVVNNRVYDESFKERLNQARQKFVPLYKR